MALDDTRIVLVEPTHPGNIGAVARAMKTMSLAHLVLVRPALFPSEEADRRAIYAVDLLERARVVDDLDTAVSRCGLVIGCSARLRTVPHPVLDARESARRIVAETAAGAPAAVVFGPERTGLANHDLDRCTHQLRIPTDERFSSLNLASAVQLVCYELLLASREGADALPAAPAEPPSSHAEMEYFFEHLERALDSRGFLSETMRDATLLKLRRVFNRARPSSGELKLLRSLMRLVHEDGE